MTVPHRYKDARLGESGMVAAAHPNAVIAGLDALREGGNAMDACIIMAGVTAVVLPHMCGLGGDAFFIYYDASDASIRALNSSGFTGDLATVEFFKAPEKALACTRAANSREMMPQDGILSAAVPGAPMVYEMGLKRYGSFSLRRALEPAINLSEKGFLVSPDFAKAVMMERKKQEKYPDSQEIFLTKGSGPRIGRSFRQPDLGKTLRQFADEGSEYIYKGAFAERFYKLSEKSQTAHWGGVGSSFTGSEFGRFHSSPPEFYVPLSVDYRGYRIYQTAPVSQGFLTLEQMKIMETFDIASFGPGSTEAVHFMVEAKKLAFQDRNLYAGDPDYSGFDARKFISAQHAQKMRQRISPFAVLSKTELGGGDSKTGDKGDTTFFAAVDKWGNACSFIHSNAFSFGSGLVVPGTGVILNNRAGRSFLLEKGHPNCVLPGKRPMHTLNAYMVFKDGHFFIAGGTPGGDGQPQWNAQMLSLMIDHGYGPQAACDFPRWFSFPGTDVLFLDRPMVVRVESRAPAETIMGLERLGHSVQTVGPWSGGGGAQIIMRDPHSGCLIGGSDRRVEGLALGI